MSYLPSGLWKSKVSVIMEFTNLRRGVAIVKHAPLGLTIRESWRVLELDAVPDGRAVQLEAELEGSWLVLVAFSWFMDGNHRLYLETMVQAMRDGAGSGG